MSVLDWLLKEFLARSEIMLEALRKIASYSDTAASEHLERTGSYSLFDEPGSVEIARKALEKVKG